MVRSDRREADLTLSAAQPPSAFEYGRLRGLQVPYGVQSIETAGCTSRGYLLVSAGTQHMFGTPFPHLLPEPAICPA